MKAATKEVSQYIKSPLRYIGGKYRILDQIFKRFPNNIDTFVDLFAGGLNVSVNINANKYICNDVMWELAELYNYLADNSVAWLLNQIEQTCRMFSLSRENGDGYYELRKSYNAFPNPIKFFCLICFSFNHQIRFNKDHEFNTSFGRNKSSWYRKGVKEDFISFCNRLHTMNAEFTDIDFRDLDLSNLGENDLVYCDPPYIISDATYGKEVPWSLEDEKALLNFLDELSDKGVMFALSNVLWHKDFKNNELIKWSKDYIVFPIDINYSNCNYHRKDKNSDSMEVLITNFK